MRNHYSSLVTNAYLLQTNAERSRAAIALVRIGLQYLCLSLAEWAIESNRQFPDVYRDKEQELPDLNELRKPSDGSLVSSLAELVVACRNLGWVGIEDTLFSPVDRGRRAAKIASGCNNFLQILEGWVQARNDGPEGHGIPNDSLDGAAVILDVAQMLSDRFGPILPVATESGRLFFGESGGRKIILEMLRTFDSDLVCYRYIKSSADGKCVIIAQRQTSLTSHIPVRWESKDVLRSWNQARGPSYRISESFDEQWNPLLLLPDRLTEHFKGRQGQLDELAKWADDNDSKACMIFGDGGIGKTTLAVEFVHRLLEGRLTCEWRPDMVTFYTAKQTRWGTSGLERISVHSVGIADVAIDIVRALEQGALERTWFDGDVRSTLQRLSGYLKGWGVSRDQHLIVLDNTETMATNPEEVRTLAGHIRELCRRGGRVLLTSRRREAIEALPLEILPLGVDESVALLRARAEMLDRKPLLMAGDSTLRKFANKLGNRPLVLEVFVQTLADQQLGLQHAFDRVLQMQRQDLGEFLYTDAWKRLSDRLRFLLLLMSQVSDIHDGALLKLCCFDAGVTVMEAEEALMESIGIASVTVIDGIYTYALNRDFTAFCAERSIFLAGVNEPSPERVARVKKRFGDYIKSKSSKVSDRVSQAFRNPFARAAYLAYQEGRYDDCELYYESAVSEDSGNGYLFDRYAYFLMGLGRFADALEKSNQAVRLLSTDPDVWFTKGMIEGHLSSLDEALSSLGRAQYYGKQEYLCLVQKVHVCLRMDPPLTEKAGEFLRLAEQRTPSGTDPLVNRHRGEMSRLNARITRARAR